MKTLGRTRRPAALAAALSIRRDRLHEASTTPSGAIKLETHVDDWRDEVIYQLLVDRFANGDPGNDYSVDLEATGHWHGGDWQGSRTSSTTSRASASPRSGSPRS